MDTKFCKSCNLEKNFDQFYNRYENKDGKSTRCKTCLYQIKTEYIQKNKEKHKTYCRIYHKKYMRERYKSDPIFKIQQALSR